MTSTNQRIFEPSLCRLVVLWGLSGTIGSAVGLCIVPPAARMLWWIPLGALLGAIAGATVKKRFRVVISDSIIGGPGRFNQPTEISSAAIDVLRTRAQRGLEPLLWSFMIWSKDGKFIRVVRRYFTRKTLSELLRAIREQMAG